MQKFIPLLVSILNFHLVFAQSEFSIQCEYRIEHFSGDTIYTQPSLEPEFTGTENDLNLFIENNFIQPENKFDLNLLYLEIIIETDGTISEYRLLLNNKPEFQSSIKTLVEKMPSWKAGECNGRKIKCEYIIPIRLKN